MPATRTGTSPLWLPSLESNFVIRFQVEPTGSEADTFRKAIAELDLPPSRDGVWSLSYSREKVPHQLVLRLEHPYLEFEAGQGEGTPMTRPQARAVLNAFDQLENARGILGRDFPGSYSSFLIPTEAPFPAIGASGGPLDLRPVGVRYESVTGMTDLIIDRSGGDSLWVQLTLPMSPSRGQTINTFWKVAISLTGLLAIPPREVGNE